MGFTPLASSTPVKGFTPGFTPLSEEEQPSAFAPAIETVRDIGRVYPVLETAGNLATQAIAMPVAGIAGLGAAATKALGITNTEPADVVHRVAGALTYQPQTESGQHLTNAVMYPFEKLQQAGQYAGGKTLEATGSPVLATVADTAVNVLPMALPMKAAEPKGTLARAADKHLKQQAVKNAQAVAPEAMTVETPLAQVQPVVPTETALARNAQGANLLVNARVNTGAPRAGFTPIEETLARVAPPEVRETPQALLDAPALDRVHETELVRPATLEANPLGLPEQQRAIETAVPVLDVPAIASMATVPKSIEAGAARATMPEAARFDQSAHSNIPDAGVTKLPPAEVEVFRAKEAMDAVGVTGIDRTNIIAAVRRGELTAADVVKAYPTKSAGEPAVVVPPARPAEVMGKVILESRLAEIAAGQEATAQRSRGFTPLGEETKQLPSEVDAAAHEAATSPLNNLIDPTQAQKEAGNYKKGHVTIQGLDFAIENPQGSKRSGIDPNGQAWNVTMPNHYGYIKRTIGADGDHVDVYIGNNTKSDRVFIVDQVDASTGAFDEHKIMFGFGNMEEAVKAYHSGFSDGRGGERIGSITPMSVDTFKTWLKNGDTKQPLVARQQFKNPKQSTEPSEAIRLNVEQLAGLSKDAGQFKLAPQLVFAIQKAKSGTGDAAYFTRIADMFKGKDDRIHASLMGIADAIESGNAIRNAGGRPQGFKPLTDGLPDAAEQSSASNMATPQPVAMAAPRSDTVQNSFAPGANYAPLVNDHPASPTTGAKSVADLPAPIRREKILGEFAKDLGTTIYEGRVKGKDRLGFFHKNLQEVRIKRSSDLEVAAHEIGHLLDDRVPAISNAWRSNNALREELKSISYDHSKVSEGYAEGVRLFLTQPDVLQAKAPAVHAWLENFTNTHQYGSALRKAQEGMTGWFGQDALNRARSKIGEHKPLADYFDGGWDKFRQSALDDLHGIYRMERDLKGDIAPMGAYETARLSRASHSISDGAIRFGAPVKKADGSFTFKGKGLEEILKPVAEHLDDALLYFVGRSARELQVQGREHLFTMGEVDAMLRLRQPEFETAFKEYQTFNKAVLDFAEAQGVINPEARRMWQRTQYMPFHRVGTMDGFKGKPGDWSGIKALTGGTTNIRDVLGNMVSNAAQLIDKSVKNEARRKIADLANETGGGRFMVKIDAEMRPVRIDKAQVLDGLLKAMGIDRHAPGLPKKVQMLIKGLEDDLAKSPGMVELFAGNQPPAGSNVVAVLNGGKPTWYEVGDPVLYRALSAIDRPTQNWVVKWLGLPKRIGQTTITLTPDFMVANIARDTIMGSVMSRSGFRPVMDSLQGMRMRMTNDPMYKDFIANGGGMSSIYLDETRFRAKLEKFYQRQGIDYRTVLNTPDKLLNAVETIADAFEMSTRLGEYKRATEKGENPRHAAYLGREVSTDFAMRGDSQALGFMFDTVIFLKAAVVSMDRLYRGIAHDPNKGAIAAKSGMIALASVGLYLMNRDNPRYQDMDDWKKDTHWHFFVPVNGKEEHFMYPKIWEIGAVASIAERTVEKTIASDPQGLGKDFARIVKNTFSLNMMPQAIAPLAEQYANRNSFTKAPIETPGMENMQPFLRAKPTTSETMKAAGMATKDLPESMQVNPVRAEALLRGYFNTWAMYGLALSDNAFFGDQLPKGRTDQLPVVRRFYSQEPPPHTKYETMFYDMLGEANRLHGTMRELDKLGLQGIADAKEKAPLATEAKPLGRAADNLSKINADMREVRRGDSTPEEKRRRLDELTVERNALLKATVLDTKKPTP